ncbi:hypothetical protein A3D73_00925 [Candidatus Uhrbacteria bacterium RIFCSPHIGHO2_02_FULL_60_44]|nr:MAG: hypothetical protein A3D73_00925 [Candidatus Uhrbacteria bacterium RIFCSPHIGHO2_02_FULL_60_44]
MFAPVRTITTRSQELPGDDVWFDRMPSQRVSRFNTNQMLTHFSEGKSLFFIMRSRVREVCDAGYTPLVGMTPLGLERLESRPDTVREFPLRTVFLQPADPQEFCERLVREGGLDQKTAEDETQRAVRLSTIPPSVKHTPSIVPISGTFNDVDLVDQAIASIMPP